MSQMAFAQLNNGQPFETDPRQLVRRHLLVIGQTGSGKTTSTLSLLSLLQQTDYTTIILDPTGEYAKLPNAVTYRLGDNAYLEAGQFDVDQLTEALQIHTDDLLKDRLVAAINDLRIQQNINQEDRPYQKRGVKIDDYQAQLIQLGDWAQTYDPQLLADQLIEEFIVPNDDQTADYSLLGQRYDRQMINQEWYTLATIRQRLASHEFQVLFDPDPASGTTKTEMNFVIKMFLEHRTTHRSLVIDLSALKEFGPGQGVVISALLKHLLAMRLAGSDRFPVNIVLDEAHRYLPKDETELASNGIFQILREGRKVGLSMTLTTQSPLDLPARLRSQFANLLIHHLTSPEELKSLAVADQVDLADVSQLGVGEALLLLDGQPSQHLSINLPQWWSKTVKK